MDYFDQVNKTMKEGQERWEQIEKLCKTVQFGLDSDDTQTQAMAELLLLLVEHIRPMNPSQEQMDEVTKGLGNLLSAFKGRTK